MGYKFKRGEPLSKGVQRVVREQIDKALAEIDNPELDRHEAVHQVRKRCKKIRAVLRIVRPRMEKTYKKENGFFRDAAGKLSDLRDAQAQLESFELLMDGQEEEKVERFQTVHQALLQHREALAQEEGALDARLAEFREAMCEARERIRTWPLKGRKFGVVEGGLRKTYRRGRKALEDACEERTSAAFHEWRKRVKYHWYHARLLKGAWPRVTKALRKELKQLSDYLGDDHDLAVLRERISSAPDTYGPPETVNAFLELLDTRRLCLEAEAETLGRRVYASRPKGLTRVWRAWWEAAVEEARREARAKAGKGT